MNFCVPTGNFGDILAGYYAKQMGLPVGQLVCASNKNNVLTEFITTGTTTAAARSTRPPRPRWTFWCPQPGALLYHVSGSDAERWPA